VPTTVQLSIPYTDHEPALKLPTTKIPTQYDRLSQQQLGFLSFQHKPSFSICPSRVLCSNILNAQKLNTCIYVRYFISYIYAYLHAKYIFSYVF